MDNNRRLNIRIYPDSDKEILEVLNLVNDGDANITIKAIVSLWVNANIDNPDIHSVIADMVIAYRVRAIGSFSTVRNVRTNIAQKNRIEANEQPETGSKGSSLSLQRGIINAVDMVANTKAPPLPITDAYFADSSARNANSDSQPSVKEDDGTSMDFLEY